LSSIARFRADSAVNAFGVGEVGPGMYTHLRFNLPYLLNYEYQDGHIYIWYSQ